MSWTYSAPRRNGSRDRRANTIPGGGWFTHGDHAVDLTRWLFQTEFADVVADMRTLRYTQDAVEDYA